MSGLKKGRIIKILSDVLNLLQSIILKLIHCNRFVFSSQSSLAAKWSDKSGRKRSDKSSPEACDKSSPERPFAKSCPEA